MTKKDLIAIIEAIVYNLEENVNEKIKGEGVHSFGKFEEAIEIQNTVKGILEIYGYKN